MYSIFWYIVGTVTNRAVISDGHHISIFSFDPQGQFQGQNIGQKVITPKFTQITKMMSD